MSYLPFAKLDFSRLLRPQMAGSKRRSRPPKAVTDALFNNWVPINSQGVCHGIL